MNTISSWFPRETSLLTQNDQSYYNVLVLASFFQFNGWDLIKSYPGDKLTSMAIEAVNFNIIFPSKHKQKSTTPLALHQYNRVELYWKKLVDLCKSDATPEQYIHHF